MVGGGEEGSGGWDGGVTGDSRGGERGEGGGGDEGIGGEEGGGGGVDGGEGSGGGGGGLWRMPNAGGIVTHMALLCLVVCPPPSPSLAATRRPMPPNKVRLPVKIKSIKHRRDIGALCGCGSAFSSTKMPHRLFECIDTVNRGFAGDRMASLVEGVASPFSSSAISSSAGSAVAGPVDGTSMVSKSKGSSD